MHLCVCVGLSAWEGNRDIDLSVIIDVERVILTWSWLVKKSFCFYAVPFLLLSYTEGFTVYLCVCACLRGPKKQDSQIYAHISVLCPNTLKHLSLELWLWKSTVCPPHMLLCPRSQTHCHENLVTLKQEAILFKRVEKWLLFTQASHGWTGRAL